MLTCAGEQVRVLRGGRDWAHAIVCPIKGDAAHGDGRLRCQAVLNLQQRRVARREGIPVAIGLDDNVHEIGVVKRGGAALERGIVKRPGG